MLRQGECGRLGDRVGGGERQGGEGHQRHVVDDRPLGTGEQRQEGLGHGVGAEEVDRQVLFDRGTIAQVIEKPDAGVVDQDIERFDALDRRLDLPRVGHVQSERCDALIRVDQRPARSGVHPSRASPQGVLDQRLTDAAIGAGDQHCLVCDCHALSPS